MFKGKKSILLLKTIRDLQKVQTEIPLDSFYSYEVQTAINTLIDIKKRVDKTQSKEFKLFGLIE